VPPLPLSAEEISSLQFFPSGSSRHADAATPAANRRAGSRTRGKDPGAIIEVARKERDPADREQVAALEEQGVQAVMTRDDDYFIGLGPRVAKAEV